MNWYSFYPCELCNGSGKIPIHYEFNPTKETDNDPFQDCPLCSGRGELKIYIPPQEYEK